MAKYIVDINYNDDLPTAIRKCNHNFRNMMASQSQLSNTVEAGDYGNGGTGGSIEDLNTAIENAKKELGSITSSAVSSINRTVEDANRKVDEIVDGVNIRVQQDITEALLKIYSAENSAIESIDDKVSNATSSIDSAVNEAMQKLEGSKLELDGKINSLTDKVDSFDSSIQSLSQRVEEASEFHSLSIGTNGLTLVVCGKICILNFPGTSFNLPSSSSFTTVATIPANYRPRAAVYGTLESGSTLGGIIRAYVRSDDGSVMLLNRTSATSSSQVGSLVYIRN